MQWKGSWNTEAKENINEYPAVWLRDNCQCPNCYNKHANARLLLMKNLDIEVQPKHISVEDNQVYEFLQWSTYVFIVNFILNYIHLCVILI